MKNLFVKSQYRHFLGILVSCACVGFILWKINLNDVWMAIIYFHWPILLWGMISLLFGYSMRIIRWSVILRAGGAQVSSITCAAPFLGSIALNNILPMRLGDVVRALVFPTAIGVSKITATGSMVIERLLDLTTLLICLMIGLISNSKATLPDWMMSTAISLAVFVGISLMIIFLFSAKLSKWCNDLAHRSTARWNRLFLMLSALLGSFNAMSRIHILVITFVLSMFVWMGEAGLFWSLLQGFSLKANFSIAVTIMAIATLSTLVPSSPGYVGPFHLAAFAAISMLNGTPEQAASFAVLSHLSVWLPTTVMGAIALLMNPEFFIRIKTETTSIQTANEG